MPLFEFDLLPVEKITPWGEGVKRNLSWFALTDGYFRMPVGEHVLFEYSKEMAAHWETEGRDVCYQIAALARDVLECLAAAISPLPPLVERLAMDWELLTQLENQSDSDEDDGVLDLNYKAWRWLGERSPWASYLVAQPKFSFVRLGNDIRICWDNRRKKVDDIPVWTAEFGMHTMSVKAFQEECASFKDRLLTTMEQRIIEIESGAATPLVSIDTQSLRRQHEEWRVELSAYFGSYTPDIGWPDCETALSAVAANKGINL